MQKEIHAVQPSSLFVLFWLQLGLCTVSWNFLSLRHFSFFQAQSMTSSNLLTRTSASQHHK